MAPLSLSIKYYPVWAVGGNENRIQMQKCPKCGNEFSDATNSCPNCGCLLEPIVQKGQQIMNVKQLSSSQRKMIVLAKPIGILALIMVVIEMLGVVLYNPEEIGIYSKGYRLLYSIVFFMLVFLVEMWFIQLLKGSGEKTSMKSISIIAVIGFGFYFMASVLNLIRSIRDLFDKDACSLFISGSEGSILGGLAFLIVSKYFSGKLKVFSILAGSLLLIGRIISTCNSPYQITNLMSILIFVSFALFFFVFNKTNQS
jgi:hypothetical protein